MDIIKKFDQEKYDSFKLFLISNFNIEFLKSKEQRVSESIDIKTKNGIIKCDYTINQSLEISPYSPSSNSYKKIIDHLKKSNEIISSQSHLSSDHVDSFPNSFFEHLLICSDCQNKINDIISHISKTKS